MRGLSTAAVIALGVWSFYHPETGSWIYIASFVVLFQGLLMLFIYGQHRIPVEPDEPPYHFSVEEADFVRRHRFSFKFPLAAQGASSMLAAMGLIGLLLSPWLVYHLQWTQAAIIGFDIPLVGYITRRLNPKYTLVLAAHKGNERAQKEIEIFNSAWRKILAEKGIAPQGAATRTDSQPGAS